MYDKGAGETILLHCSCVPNRHYGNNAVLHSAATVQLAILKRTASFHALCLEILRKAALFETGVDKEMRSEMVVDSQFQ